MISDYCRAACGPRTPVIVKWSSMTIPMGYAVPHSHSRIPMTRVIDE